MGSTIIRSSLILAFTLIGFSTAALRTQRERVALVRHFEGIYQVLGPVANDEAMVSTEDGWLKIWHPYFGGASFDLHDLNLNVGHLEGTLFGSTKIEVSTWLERENKISRTETRQARTWKTVERKELTLDGEDLTFRYARKSYVRNFLPPFGWIRTDGESNYETKYVRTSRDIIPIENYIGRYMPNVAAQAARDAAECDADLSNGG